MTPWARLSVRTLPSTFRGPALMGSAGLASPGPGVVRRSSGGSRPERSQCHLEGFWVPGVLRSNLLEGRSCLSPNPAQVPGAYQCLCSSSICRHCNQLTHCDCCPPRAGELIEPSPRSIIRQGHGAGHLRWPAVCHGLDCLVSAKLRRKPCESSLECLSSWALGRLGQEVLMDLDGKCESKLRQQG